MSKKKSQLQSFSKYAIIDLPYDYCEERAIALYANNPLAMTHQMAGDQLAITYKITTDHWKFDAHALISRWEGTKTRVALRFAPHVKYDDTSENTNRLQDYEARLKAKFIQFVLGVSVVAIPVLLLLEYMSQQRNLPFSSSFAGTAVLFIAIIIGYWIFTSDNDTSQSQSATLSDSTKLHKRLTAVWETLIKDISSNTAGRSAYIIENDRWELVEAQEQEQKRAQS